MDHINQDSVNKPDCIAGSGTQCSSMPNAKPKWVTGTQKIIGMAKQKEKFQAKIFLDCQNKL